MLKVFRFFQSENYDITEFKKDWQSLSDEDKAQLRNGIENGTLNY